MFLIARIVTLRGMRFLKNMMMRYLLDTHILFYFLIL